MNTLFPGGLDKGTEPSVFQVSANYMGNFNHIIECEGWFRVDVDEQEVGGHIGTGSRERCMDLKGRKICNPDEGIEVIAEHEMDIPIGSFRIMGKYVYVIRCTCRGVLLIEPFPFDPVGEAVHGHRPVAQEGKEERGYTDVIQDNVLLGDACFREQH